MYLVVCCVINIILDIVLVIGFRMGIAGAAIATVISQGVSAVLVTRALMYSYGILKLELRAIRFHASLDVYKRQGIGSAVVTKKRKSN